ncbi:hypothetical protein [Zoogloea sp.]|uniref:hypothetical protein n=1 Tax=Zoogloea sp. TaxID=49181 RepID=UPI0025EB1564|nr:hypothetical protein [Zoogloea sp.]MCK6395780.1 hypothetical protein [Zoogloea sp.]
MNLIRLTQALLFFAASTACQAQIRDPSLPDEFYTGSVVLEYSLFGKGASGAKDLKQLHDQGEWTSLARKVIEQKSLGYDVYYYYLAVSAKKLGFESAAKAFGDRALSSADKCKSVVFLNVCQGVDVKRSINALFGLNRKLVELPVPAVLEQLSQSLRSPIGIGEMKLGDRMEQVLNQDQSRSVRVIASTNRGEKFDEDLEVSGAEFVSATVSTPLSSKPLPAQLEFNDGRLIGLELTLGDGELGSSRLQSVKNQIEGRFGAPAKVLEEMTTVRCVFGNANSYVLNSGNNLYTWNHPMKDGWFVVAELSDSATGICPDKSTSSRTEARTATYRVSLKKLSANPTKPSLF